MPHLIENESSSDHMKTFDLAFMVSVSAFMYILSSNRNVTIISKSSNHDLIRLSSKIPKKYVYIMRRIVAIVLAANELVIFCGEHSGNVLLPSISLNDLFCPSLRKQTSMHN